jgi:hypothetical protein
VDRPVDRANQVHSAQIAVYKGRIEIAYDLYPDFSGNGQGLWFRTFYPAGKVVTKSLGHYGLPDLAIDGNGKTHLVFAPWDSDSRVHYLTNQSGSWLTTLLPTQETFVRLAIDPQGHAYAVWTYCSGCNPPQQRIVYATNRSGSWVHRTLSFVGGFAEIAYASTGHVHLAFDTYNANGDSVVRYATNQSGVWLTHDWIYHPTDTYFVIPNFPRVAFAAGRAYVAHQEDDLLADPGHYWVELRSN